MRIRLVMTGPATARLLVILILPLAGCAPRALRAGDDGNGPWWMRQTAMTRDGRLDLKARDWWPRAAQLKVGESLTLDCEDRAGAMLVRREHIRNVGGQVEAIVWIIDDDEDGSIARGGDQDSDCYVVDYHGDGTVDRIVDYIDDDGDDEPDEMDIRYFEGGELRSVWVGVDLDDDGKMWDLQGYEYSHNFFASDPYGDEMIYMNKFDPRRGEWIPISECPFAFYDTDGDGYSETVVRVSAAPIGFNAGTDPDYANDAGRYRGRWSDEMRRMGAVNVRYSFDIDNLSGKEFPLHYDYGFNLVGAVPYPESGSARFNPRRRPPQVTKVIPHDKLRAFCDAYPARETGFSWHEGHDDTIAIGDAPDPGLDFRWEGVFWIWERRFMSNTGGPGQKWNVRREWTDRPAERRELYYSAIDRRIHLFGAKEGWLEVGHFAGLGRIGELRMFDTDADGYFDRWEVCTGDSARPSRVTQVSDPRARRIPFDQAWLHRFYTAQVLPEALAANERLMAAMRKVRPFELPPGLQRACSEGPDNYRRFAQDVARERQYQDLKHHLAEAADQVLRGAKRDDLRSLDSRARATTRNSATAWRLSVRLRELEEAYGRGDFDRAIEILTELEKFQEAVK